MVIETEEASRSEWPRVANMLGGEAAGAGAGEGAPCDAALGALLDLTAAEDGDAEQWVASLGGRVARLEALNVGGMLAAGEGRAGEGGAKLAGALQRAADPQATLHERLQRYSALVRVEGGAGGAARGEAARGEAGARALLAELRDLTAWLDEPLAAHLDDSDEMVLTTEAGRAAAMRRLSALQLALQRAPAPPRARLAAVRDTLRALHRDKQARAHKLARHLNNMLIHLGNEANTSGGATCHRAPLLPHAELMLWLKHMDYKAYLALLKVYVSTWSRVLERDISAACDAATIHTLDEVLTLVENLCNGEQEFCTQFFHLDVEVKGESGEQELEKINSRALQKLVFPNVESILVGLVHNLDKQDPYGAMRALACVGKRVMGEDSDAASGDGVAEGAGSGGAGAGGAGAGGAGAGGAMSGGAGAGGEARWSRAALAAACVAAKRAADRAVTSRLDAMPEAVRQASRRPKCGVLSFLPELEQLLGACDVIFSGWSRRGDVQRWQRALVSGAMLHVQRAAHPRTPRAALHAENYHILYGIVSAQRSGALEELRRECRARYHAALRAYTARYNARPLEKLTHFLEGVSEVVASGVREDEVCYRAAYSKHELRRVLALYPPHEVRKSIHRLYRSVEKHLSAESALLQVVWRHMQQELIAQHNNLQSRIAACYPGAGLTMPVTTQDILEAFSDIAREH